MDTLPGMVEFAEHLMQKHYADEAEKSDETTRTEYADILEAMSGYYMSIVSNMRKLHGVGNSFDCLFGSDTRTPGSTYCQLLFEKGPVSVEVPVREIHDFEGIVGLSYDLCHRLREATLASRSVPYLDKIEEVSGKLVHLAKKIRAIK